MARLSAYIIIPCVATCISFGTDYFGIYVTALSLLCIFNFIRRKHVTFCLAMIIFTFAFSISCANTHTIHNKKFYPFIDKQATLTCVVDETPVYDNGEIQFCAKMLFVTEKGTKHNLDGKVYVSVNGESSQIDYGDKISFKTALSIPAENYNEGSFNYRNYLRSQGIHVICNTYDFSIENHGTYEKINPVFHRLFSLRKTLIDKCDKYFDEYSSAFVNALLLGYKAHMPADMKDHINKAGISHVVSVSGMHLSIIMMLAAFLLRRVKFRGSLIITPIINIIIAVFVMCLTGFSPSVKRAAIMVIVSNITSIIRRENDSVQSLSVALIILLAINPCALGDVRLSLSATAVLGIILLKDKIDAKLMRFIKTDFLRSSTTISISAQIMTLPLMIYYFNSVSIVSILTNTVIIPFIPYIMGTGIVFLAMPLSIAAEFISNGIWLAVRILLAFTKFMASVPYACIPLTLKEFIYAASIIAVIIYLMRKTLICQSFRRNLWLTGVSIIAVILLFFPPRSNDFKITVLNTGNSDCTLLQFPGGKTMLVSEPSKDDFWDTGKNVISPYLIKAGIKRIDYAVVSCLEKKETDSVLSLANEFDIGCIILPDYNWGKSEFCRLLKDLSKEKNIPLYLMQNGDCFSPDDNSIVEILSPDSRYLYKNDNSSLVFKVTGHGKSALFTGNIGYYTKTILCNQDSNIKADILKVANHGEYTGADKDFINLVNPRSAFICVGKNNFGNLPHEKLIDIYTDKNIHVMRTDLDDTIKYVFSKE